MKLLIYSDLHLEFGTDFALPASGAADALILAGDIINFDSPEPLDVALRGWDKPVLFVPGNHEYFSRLPMHEARQRFQGWLAARHPHVTMLCDEPAELGGVHFFGGTMWTDFAGTDRRAMDAARPRMVDYRRIRLSGARKLAPEDTVGLHGQFVAKFSAWLAAPAAGPRVVITHSAPVCKPNSIHAASPLTAAFNSLDMLAYIRQHRPKLWVYGHTHECDDQVIHGTRIISNQRGYPRAGGSFECPDFAPAGAAVAV